MVQYQAEKNGLGISEMLKVLMANTWEGARAEGLEDLILKQNQQLLLTYLMGVYVSDDASFATKAAMMECIEKIKNLATSQLKLHGTNEGYMLLTLERIKYRYKSKPFIPEAMPPGAPIGCDMD
jgi:hypothetical protein